MKIEKKYNLKELLNSSCLIDLIEVYRLHFDINFDFNKEYNNYFYYRKLYFYNFCLKHKKYFFNKDYLDEDLHKNILKINYDFKHLMDMKHAIVFLYYVYRDKLLEKVYNNKLNIFAT